MNKIRCVLLGICGAALLLILASGVFLLVFYGGMEQKTRNYILSVEPDALAHGEAVRKKVYCPGSEVFVDFSRPEIKGYERIENIVVTPKPLRMANGDVKEWGVCKVYYRSFNFYDLSGWIKTIRAGLFNRVLFHRLNDQATDAGVITFRVPFMEDLAGQTIVFDMSAAFILPETGSGERKTDVHLTDIFVTVSAQDFYREIRDLETANAEKKQVAVMILIVGSAVFFFSFVILGSIRLFKRLFAAETHNSPLAA